jgi:hypothetical protein
MAEERDQINADHIGSHYQTERKKLIKNCTWIGGLKYDWTKGKE